MTVSITSKAYKQKTASTPQLVTDPVSGTVSIAGTDGKTISLPPGGIVVSASAPNNSDGRPDGTIYIQTA